MFRVIALCILFMVNVILHTDGKLPFTEDTLKDKYGDIIFSTVIFRHGHRTPVTQYRYAEKDPQAEEYWKENWPEGIGQLTKQGKQQMYSLGKWYHERYESLVSEGYKPDLLKEESSDVDRTIMSGLTFLAGFLYPNENEMWADDGLKWQPVPVRQIPLDQDYTLALYGVKCDRYDLEKKRLKEHELMKTYYENEKYRKVFDIINAKSGLKATPDDMIQAIKNAFMLYDIFSLERARNIDLPDWAAEIYPEPLTEIAGLNFTLRVHTDQMKKIKAGVLIGKIIKEMEAKVEGKEPRTFHLYSAHDFTVVALLKSLNVENYDGHVAAHSSSVMIELRQKNKDHVVTILYKTSDTSEPQFLHVKECTDYCTLDTFKSLTKHLILEQKDWNTECTITPAEKAYLDEKVPEAESSQAKSTSD
ncbi:prostatic acid phosphatase-like isoform X2 [Planococcus citri]|uniref:prostatic acid phosphatase-like isoform X2 n=1 Tax=Planococcus citri TaxID=170843 RepID=UPI0031F8183D